MSGAMRWKEAGAIIGLCVLVVIALVVTWYATTTDPAFTKYTTRVATLEKLDTIIELLTKMKEKMP